MGSVDYWIVGAYLVGLLGCGFVLARKASQNSEAYFLGDRNLPWWALGASGMSSNLDAAGTMTIVTLLYLFGVHGFFIEMRGGVVLPIAVFMAFMGKWHRRSGVVTTAEWMGLRFGSGFGGKSARALAALTYLVITVGMIVFFLAAAGKFLSTLLPFDATTCSVGMATIALVYTLLSGLYGVVWTDVLQGFLIAGAAVYVAVRGALLLDANLLAQWEGARYNSLLPRLADSGLGEYEFFIAFLLAWIGKGLLEGLGGSGGSAYMAQRFYATRSDAECQKVGMLWIVLFSFRWPMALGFAIIGISLGVGAEDPERLLPHVLLSDVFPEGIRGLTIAALLAASMSTFDSTINAGASYATRDLFVPLFPSASERAQVWFGYAASTAVVLLGLGISLLGVESVVDVWVVIVIQLFPAFLVPFALRWYWGRFTGEGFSLGILAGFGTSTWMALTEAGALLNEIETLFGVMGVSLLGCIAGTYFSQPQQEQKLKSFYFQTRPNGLWPRAWKVSYKKELKENWLRLGAALVWQLSTFMLPMMLVLKKWGSVLLLALVWAVSFWALRRLQEAEGALPAQGRKDAP
ncbi:sodium:solute symporter [Pelagicoccus sp. NFK12]|uniref:Sodium:solute symporter n=1 Tax=Pelagicoccus enzymogenes TaxID=2773457 RepID=A0A927IFB5_9BACT|nr:sodium:solute symporter [Pelagicoccus enzymogenes]MBD5777931.1 sodium:solute symporter [Pelagicoccus enzymogenes]